MAKRRTFIGGDNESIVSRGDDYKKNVKDFKRHLVTKDRSKHTIKYYSEKLIQFESLLNEQGYATRLERITTDTITEGYIRYLQENKRLKYSSVTAGLRALRSFFNWSVSQGVISKSPMDGITIGKANVTAVETFTSEQLEDLFSQMDLQTFVGLRDYTIVSVMIETGIRLRELVDIKVRELRMEDSQIFIHGKNGDDRLVPIQDNCKKVLRRYVEVRGDAPEEYLFLTHDDTQMSRKAVQERVSKYGRKANITNVRCSPHTFRHTFAKMSIKNGANIFELQKVLGHSTLDMVKTYVNLFSDDVYEAHRRFSPLENLRK